MPGSRALPPGPSRCATPSPVPSGLEQAIPATAYAASPAIRAPADDPGRPAAGPDAAAERAAAVRRRARRPERRPDRRGADPQLPAARTRPARRADVARRSAREELEMRRRIDAGRASTRRSVQIVVGITVVFVLGPGAVQPRLRRALLVAARPDRPARRPALLRRRVHVAAAALGFDLPERFLFTAGVSSGKGGHAMILVLLCGALAGRRALCSGASVRDRRHRRRRCRARPARLPRASARTRRVPDRRPAARRASPCAMRRWVGDPSAAGVAGWQAAGRRARPTSRSSVARWRRTSAWRHAGVAGSSVRSIVLAPSRCSSAAAAASRRGLRHRRLAGLRSPRSRAARPRTAPRLPPRRGLVPRPGRDEPRRWPRRAGGARRRSGSATAGPWSASATR